MPTPVLPFMRKVPAVQPTARPDTKVRNGVVLFIGDDVPSDLADEIELLVGRRLRDTPTDFMVSGPDAEIYDYFDEECE